MKIVIDRIRDIEFKEFLIMCIYVISAYYCGKLVIGFLGYGFYFRTSIEVKVFTFFWLLSTVSGIFIARYYHGINTFRKIEYIKQVIIYWIMALATLVWMVLFLRFYHLSAFVIGVLLCIFNGCVCYLFFNKEGGIHQVQWADFVTLLLEAFFCVYLGERLVTPQAAMNVDFFLINVIMIFIILSFLVFVTGRWNFTVAFGAFGGSAWALTHYYVYEFRGTMFAPSDVKGANTALTVVSQYHFRFTKEMWGLGLLIIICCLVALCSPKKRWISRKKWEIPLRIVTACLIMVLLYRSNWPSLLDYDFSFWNLRYSYDAFGYTFGFSRVAKSGEVSKPNGYSEEWLQKMAKDYAPKEQEVSDVKPNIILIMNETFADVGDVGKLETNIDYMPYLHSANMKPNTKAGRSLVSVFGASTCNSEYEMLTGNSVEYTPALLPYVTEIKSQKDTLVSTLKEQGYHTIATHPELATNWNRNKVYDYFGFDEQVFVDEYEDAEMLRKWTVSDRDVYHKIESWMEGCENKDPQFIFAVTMQNHGGYDGYTKLRVTDEAFAVQCFNYPSGILNQYLSLMYESDTAFSEFMEAVDRIPEPTIVLMFGDHFPKLGDDVYQKIYGKPIKGLEYNELVRFTPYIMHANYDVDLSAMEDYISLNYMAPKLLQITGNQMTAYDNFRMDMQKQIPLINACGYQTAEGEWREITDTSQLKAGTTDTAVFESEGQDPYEAKIAQYNMLEYAARYKKQDPAMFRIKKSNK